MTEPAKNDGRRLPADVPTTAYQRETIEVRPDEVEALRNSLVSVTLVSGRLPRASVPPGVDPLMGHTARFVVVERIKTEGSTGVSAGAYLGLGYPDLTSGSDYPVTTLGGCFYAGAELHPTDENFYRLTIRDRGYDLLDASRPLLEQREQPVHLHFMVPRSNLINSPEQALMLAPALAATYDNFYLSRRFSGSVVVGSLT